MMARAFGRRLRASLQMGPVDCGPANLRALCLNSGIIVDNPHIRDLCSTSQSGTSLFGLRDAAEALGFDAQLCPLDLYDLRDHADSYLPVIVTLRARGPLHHFVTIYAFRGDAVIIMDPIVGIIKMEFDELRSRMHRSAVPFADDMLQSEESSPANRHEILQRLLANGITASEAEAWVERHSLFLIDDCLKYADLLENSLSKRTFSSRRAILRGLLETDILTLPAGFGTKISGTRDGRTKLVSSSLALVVRGKPSVATGISRNDSTLRRLLGILKIHYRFWAPFALLGFCLSILGLIFPIVAGLVIESLDTGWPPLIVVLLAAGVARFYSMYLNLSRSRGVNRIQQALILRFKSGLLLKFNRSPEVAMQYRMPGELMTRVDESSELPAFIMTWGTSFFATILSLLAAIVMLANSFWIFLAVQISGMVAGAVANEYFTRRLRRLSRDVLETNTAYNNRFTEALRGLEALRLIQAGDVAFFEADEAAAESTRAQYRQQDWLLLQRASSGLLYSLVTLFMAVFAFVALDDGTASPALIVTSFSLAALVSSSFQRLLSLRQDLERNSVVLDRYEEFADSPDVSFRPFERDRSSSTTEFKESSRGDEWNVLELIDLTFAYGRNGFSLQDMTLELNRGECVCLLGHSGAGKSTLFDLLCGSLEPTQGSIAVDNKRLGWWDLRSWGVRRIEQEPFLLRGTVRENILFGQPDPGDEQLRHISAVAGLDSMLNSDPLGLEREIGGRRAGLSGGEAKRVCLARTLLRRPRILLLDETLSGVDWSLRRDILNNLTVHKPYLTLVIATHDPSDVLLCDRAVVLERGRKVEDDSAAKLQRDSSSRLYRMLNHNRKIA